MAWSLVVAGALGCATDPTVVGVGPDDPTPPPPTTTTAPPPTPTVTFLTPEEHAVRASLALRGRLPTADELAVVRADLDPAGLAAVGGLVDGWIASPEFGVTIRNMHGEQLLVFNDANGGNRLPQLGPLVDYDGAEIYRSTSEEPLRLVEKVVTEGRPYTEIVTADYMLTDEIVSDAFGPPFDPEGPEWQVSHWTDGRPQAGILSSTQVWRRHLSNASNFHRARANVVMTRFLLCEEIASRPVDFAGVTLPVTSDHEAVADALMTEPTCVNCHQILDPLSATLWGFKRNMFTFFFTEGYDNGCSHELIPDTPPEEGVNYWDDGCYPARFYNPENEDLWQLFGLRPPAYYGTPIDDLEDLGREVAADPRFTDCAIERFSSYFGQIPIDSVPATLVDELRPAFEEAGLDARALVKAIVMSDTFRARAIGVAPAPSDPEHAGMMTMRPEQLSTVLEQLTGFRYVETPDRGNKRCAPFCNGEVDLLVTEDYGYQSMLGGADAKYHPVPIHTGTPLRTLALDRITAEAAGWVVAADLALADPASRKLLGLVDGTETGGETVRAQIAALHDVILREDAANEIGPDGVSELDATVALFDGEIARSGDPAEAWRLVITALLRDPRLLHF